MSNSSDNPLENKKWYNVNLKQKIENSLKKTSEFKLGLDENVDKIKDKV